MQLSKSFEVACSLDHVLEFLDRDDALTGLFSNGQTELVGREGDRRTTRTEYRALGRDGEATFHFDTLMDGSLRFEKVCDGNVWREMRGTLVAEAVGDDDGCTRVTLEMEGRTKTLVPEFTIKGPMEEQIAEMSDSLRSMLEA